MTNPVPDGSAAGTAKGRDDGYAARALSALPCLLLFSCVCDICVF